MTLNSWIKHIVTMGIEKCLVLNETIARDVATVLLEGNIIVKLWDRREELTKLIILSLSSKLKQTNKIIKIKSTRTN